MPHASNTPSSAGEALFRIIPAGEDWRLEFGEQRISYATREAAFEAAVLAAQRAMREAHAVHITVDRRAQKPVHARPASGGRRTAEGLQKRRP